MSIVLTGEINDTVIVGLFNTTLRNNSAQGSDAYTRGIWLKDVSIIGTNGAKKITNSFNPIYLPKTIHTQFCN